MTIAEEISEAYDDGYAVAQKENRRLREVVLGVINLLRGYAPPSNEVAAYMLEGALKGREAE